MSEYFCHGCCRFHKGVPFVSRNSGRQNICPKCFERATRVASFSDAERVRNRNFGKMQRAKVAKYYARAA